MDLVLRRRNGTEKNTLLLLLFMLEENHEKKKKKIEWTGMAEVRKAKSTQKWYLTYSRRKMGNL